MRDLFYMIATWITNNVTGLDNTCLRLCDAGYWLGAYNTTVAWLSIECLLISAIVVLGVMYGICTLYQIYKNKHGMIKEES